MEYHGPLEDPCLPCPEDMKTMSKLRRENAELIDANEKLAAHHNKCVAEWSKKCDELTKKADPGKVWVEGDGPYPGTYEDWMYRAQDAENRLEMLICERG